MGLSVAHLDGLVSDLWEFIKHNDVALTAEFLGHNTRVLCSLQQ